MLTLELCDQRLAIDVFRVPLLIALALSIAFGGGIVSTLYALNVTTGFGAIRLGAWEAFPNAQTAAADPYANPPRAGAATFLWGSAEGPPSGASVDDAGGGLAGGCSSPAGGKPPLARLWTLYAGNTGGQPFAVNPALPAGLNSWTVVRETDSSFTVTVSARAQPGNWLPLPTGNVSFRLTLTLLDTPTAGSSGLIDLSMPKVSLLGCGDA